MRVTSVNLESPQPMPGIGETWDLCSLPPGFPMKVQSCHVLTMICYSQVFLFISRYCFCLLVHLNIFPSGSDGKESACSVGEPGSIPGLGRSPGEGNGNPLQFSWSLENPKDSGSWLAVVHGVAKSQTQLSDFNSFFMFFHLNISTTIPTFYWFC